MWCARLPKAGRISPSATPCAATSRLLIDSHDMLEHAVPVLQRCRSLPVEHEGELVGQLALENIGAFVMIRSATRQAEQAVHAVKPGA